jgi:hypothetical protein
MRGHDNPQMYARLNNEMVRSFYTNTPPKNRGQYIEDATLPHAFMRDGDKQKNMDTILSLLKRTILS